VKDYGQRPTWGVGKPRIHVLRVLLAWALSALALLAVVIGGTGTIWGPCLGAALVILVRDSLAPSLGGHGPLVLGLVFITVVYALPRGVAGLRRPAKAGRGS